MITPRMVSVHGVKTPPNVPNPGWASWFFRSRLGFVTAGDVDSAAELELILISLVEQVVSRRTELVINFEAVGVTEKLLVHVSWQLQSRSQARFLQRLLSRTIPPRCGQCSLTQGGFNGPIPRNKKRVRISNAF